MGYVPPTTPTLSSRTEAYTYTETWSGSVCNYDSDGNPYIKDFWERDMPPLVGGRFFSKFASGSCRYCGCCAKLTEEGKCPNCGGPGK